MRLIFLGPPGVGKGTQAKRICENFDVIHLSTGDILRAEIAANSEIGNRAKSYINNGELVPDQVLLDIMDNRLRENDAQKGYLLDGFPRTITQATGLAKIMKNITHSLDATISLTADEDQLVQRLISYSATPKGILGPNSTAFKLLPDKKNIERSGWFWRYSRNN